MSKTLILLIAVFGLWLFISFTKSATKEKDKEKKEEFKPADDDVKFVNNTLVNEVTA